MQQDPDTDDIAVLNQAASGNRILYDGPGPNALGSYRPRRLVSIAHRIYNDLRRHERSVQFATDPVSQKNVGDRIIAAYTQIVE